MVAGIGRLPHRVREAAVVAAVVVVLQVLTFLPYYSGAYVPPWDFQGTYTTEAFAWWRDGGFFSPVDWLPYLWGGYPGLVNLQNSSFYLPVGLVSALTDFDQHAAAVLSALHVAFGAVGAYLLVRAWRTRPSAALVALVLWHFAAGFYSNASHLDIMRAWAWLPWVLLIASPRWPWRRWWAPPVAVLLLWQAVLASYPGILLVGVYVGAVWLVGHQLTSRPALRSYLLPLAVAGALAAAMTLLRFLPAFLTRGAGVAGDGDASVWSWSMLGTLWFGYADPSLPNDITMRSLFLPAPALVAVAFVAWRHPLARTAAATAVAAVLIGMPGTPWSSLVSALPGMDVSRFRFSDAKPYLLLMVVVLAALGVDRVLAARRERLPEAGPADGADAAPLLTVPRLVAVGGLLLLAVAVGVRGPFLAQDWVTQTAFMAVAAALLVLASTPLVERQLRTVVATLTLVAGASGLVWANAVEIPWAVPRESTEAAVFRGPVDELVAQREPARTERQRPARTHSVPLDIAPTDAELFPAGGARALYSGELSVDGYSNLKGTPTYEAMLSSLQDEATRADAWAFWLAPGIALGVPSDAVPPAAATAACVQDGDCGVVTSEPVSADPSPRIVHHVVLDAPTTLALNEAYYPGWQVRACATDGGRCVDLEPRAGDGGQLVVPDVPDGDWELAATYRQPGTGAAWLAFAVASGLALCWAAVLALRGRARRGRRPARTTAPA